MPATSRDDTATSNPVRPTTPQAVASTATPQAVASTPSPKQWHQ